MTGRIGRAIGVYLFVILWVLGLVGCGQNIQAAWQEQYDLGVKYLSEGNYEEAIIAFTAAIEIDPKRPEGFIGRGDAYLGLAVAATEGEALSEEAIAAYKNALADFLEAIDLDPLIVRAYEATAQIYRILGDQEAAAAILKQGVEATGGAELQAALEETQVRTVLMFQAAYRADGTMCESQRYKYDEQGYQIGIEYSQCSEAGAVEKTYIDQWKYDGEPGHCWFIPDRQYYDSEEEWQAEWQEEWHEPGTYNYWTSASGWDYSICLDPLIDSKSAAEVSAAGGVIVHENPPETENYEYWATAVYTFNEAGRPIAITSYYADGTISGTAVLEWETLRTEGEE